MLKNLSLFRIRAEQPAINGDDLQALTFSPCGPTQPKSIGFVPPRGEDHGALQEFVAGELMLAIRVEKRVVPSATVRERVDAMCKAIEQETGRKPGAKRRRELKADALIDLMPQAFTRQTGAFVWISLSRRLLAIESASAGFLDDALVLLGKAAPGLELAPLVTKEAPSKWMANLLLGGDDADESSFSAGREAVLVQPDLQGATVRFAKHSLEGDAVRTHLVGGKVVKALGLSHGDNVEFMLDEQMRMRKLAIEDTRVEAQVSDEDPFDANVTLATGALGPVIDALIFELGGIVDFAAPAAPSEKPIEPLQAAPAPAPDAALFNGALDPLLPQAVAVVMEHNKASISLVQRYLRIGYNRAARLLEAMEKDGLVSATNRDGNRTIITKTESTA